MTMRLSVFDHPLFLGFDRFERELTQLKKSAEGYPPYNVEQIGENGLRIALAVAGFAAGDLDVTVERNRLTVCGRQKDDRERVYLHRGIAARPFQRGFVLADGIEVKSATLDSGLMYIDMERVVPEQKTRRIEIAQAGGGGPQTIDVVTARPVANQKL